MLTDLVDFVMQLGFRNFNIWRTYEVEKTDHQAKQPTELQVWTASWADKTARHLSPYPEPYSGDKSHWLIK